MVQEVAVVVEQVFDPGEEVTVYEVIAEPPLEGAVHEIVAWPVPAAADTLVG